MAIRERPPGFSLFVLLALAVATGLAARAVYRWIGSADAAPPPPPPILR